LTSTGTLSTFATRNPTPRPIWTGGWACWKKTKTGPKSCADAYYVKRLLAICAIN